MSTRFARVLCLLAWLVVAGTAEATVYDGNNIPPFKGRTRDEVVAEYQKARKTGATYVDDDAYSWYEVMPRNISAPYEPGKLTEDSHAAMTAMNDFFRWLSGIEASTYKSEHSDSLQAGALIRNFDFNHQVSDTNKPADMSQELWNFGAACEHNILTTAIQLSPVDAIQMWLEEGYNLPKGEWMSRLYGGTLGHRLALMSGYNSGVQFGHSVRVAIGLVKGSGNFFKGAFSAFPSPGPMPRRKIYPLNSSWHVELNDDVLFVSDDAELSVTVTDIATGESYVCTKSNGKIGGGGRSLINFVQPPRYDDDSYYSGDYRIDISGLRNRGTDESAEITYTVNFIELPPEIRAPIPKSMNANEAFYIIELYAHGNEPQEWSVTEGSLPPDMSITSKDGEWSLEGRPSAEGVYTFTLQVSNKDGSDIRQYTVRTSKVSPDITTTPENFSAVPASVDMKYSNSIWADGSRPLKFSLIGGTLPPGLIISADGSISGVPESEGSYSFTVRVENDMGADTGEFTINVKRSKPTITTTSLTSPVKTNIHCSLYVYADGSLPIKWSCPEGGMPPGMSVESDSQRPKVATVSGWPEKEGVYSFKLRAENDIGYDEREYTLTFVAGNGGGETETDDNQNTQNESDNTDLRQESRHEGGDQSGGGGGGCGGFISATALAVLLLWRKR